MKLRLKNWKANYMRKEFANFMQKLGKKNKKAIFLTGDLGFMSLEGVRDAYGQRFINAGVSEQNMISMAAALASQGLEPTCYSIAPFIVFRPAEQIRLDICLHNMNVKIVGNGGGYGYGIMGGTHHAIEDIAVLTSFQNMRCFIPFCNEEVDFICEAMFNYKGPSYLRLGSGSKPEKLVLPEYSPVRKLLKGNQLTIITMGPIVLNIISAIWELSQKNVVDLYIVSELPLSDLSRELKNSIKKTNNVLILEEHVARGGLAEHISLLIHRNMLATKIEHFYAVGYPDGLYGSQDYHQKKCGIDKNTIIKTIKRLIKK